MVDSPVNWDSSSQQVPQVVPMPLVYESELLTPRGVMYESESLTPRGVLQGAARRPCRTINKQPLLRRGDAVPGDDAHDIQNSGREHLESLVCTEGLEAEEDFLEEGDDDCKITVIIDANLESVTGLQMNELGYAWCCTKFPAQAKLDGLQIMSELCDTRGYTESLLSTHEDPNDIDLRFAPSLVANPRPTPLERTSLGIVPVSGSGPIMLENLMTAKGLTRQVRPLQDEVHQVPTVSTDP